MEENKKEQELKDQLFRKKSLQRISSPEELNDYVKVANPGVWMALGAIALLLIGFIIWGIFGKIEAAVEAVIVSDDGVCTCYIKEVDVSKVVPGMPVKCGDNQYAVTSVSRASGEASDLLSDYAKYLLNAADGEWVRPVELDGATDEGVFEAKIITESINPVKFILN